MVVSIERKNKFNSFLGSVWKGLYCNYQQWLITSTSFFLGGVGFLFFFFWKKLVAKTKKGGGRLDLSFILFLFIYLTSWNKKKRIIIPPVDKQVVKKERKKEKPVDFFFLSLKILILRIKVLNFKFWADYNEIFRRKEKNKQATQ